MENILIITYYWPPAADIGTQRWLKLSKYLLKENINPIILTVEGNYDNSYLGLDNNWINEIPNELVVYKTKTFEPLRVILRKIRARNEQPTVYNGLERTRGLMYFYIRSIRSHLFIPDTWRGWNRYAIKKAKQIINDHNIKIVITTGPPHSSHIIGLKLKERFHIKWIADFRDPWTDSSWYSSAGHSYFSKLRNKSLEKKILNNADKIFTVGDSLKQLLIIKSNIINKSKISVIHNGYDKDDIEKRLNSSLNIFQICYTGTMVDNYEPYVFFNALKIVKESFTNIEIRINLVGYISKIIKQELLKIGLNIHFIPYVSHKGAMKHQQEASLLLLVIPNSINANVIITGKLFEYIATRNNIICIGPRSGDAAKIIDQCNCGKTFDRTNIHGISNFIRASINDFSNNVKMKTNEEEINRYSREYQAKLVKSEIENLLS